MKLEVNMRTKILIVTIISFILSNIVSIHLDAFFMNTFYTISGIMFSIGIGLVVTFNIQGIKNKSYIIDIRRNLDTVRNSYIIYFTISTISFIFDNYLRIEKVNTTINISDKLSLPFNASMFFFLLILFSISYFVINFLALQKLNNDIFDKMNE